MEALVITLYLPALHQQVEALVEQTAALIETGAMVVLVEALVKHPAVHSLAAPVILLQQPPHKVLMAVIQQVM